MWKIVFKTAEKPYIRQCIRSQSNLLMITFFRWLPSAGVIRYEDKKLSRQEATGKRFQPHVFFFVFFLTFLPALSSPSSATGSSSPLQTIGFDLWPRLGARVIGNKWRHSLTRRVAISVIAGRTSTTPHVSGARTLVYWNVKRKKLSRQRDYSAAHELSPLWRVAH